MMQRLALVLLFAPSAAFAQCLTYGQTVALDTDTATGLGYLSARQDWNEVRADASSALGWEEFVILDANGQRPSRTVGANDTIVLWSRAHDTKVQALPPSGGDGDVYQTTNRAAAWEQWRIVPVSSGPCLTQSSVFALRSSHNTYLYKSDADGRARTNQTQYGANAELQATRIQRLGTICEQPFALTRTNLPVNQDQLRADWSSAVAWDLGADWSSAALREDESMSCWPEVSGQQTCRFEARPCMLID